MHLKPLMGLAAAFALVVGSVTSLAQVGTVISCQGELLESGVPRTADVDLQFRLFTDPITGSQVGNTVLLSGVTPDAAGRFTSSLDFGVYPYLNDQAVFLQISVSNASAGAFTQLSRQRLTAAPFSLATRGLNVSDTGNVGVGASPLYKMTVGTSGDNIGLAQPATPDTSNGSGPSLPPQRGLATWATTAAESATST